MLFKCRHEKPYKTIPAEIEASCPEDAAQKYHFNYRTGVTQKCDDGSIVYYSIVEVNEKLFVSRIFYRGIWRSGGIRRPNPNMDDIAKILGIERDLLNGPWIGESEVWERV